jgi:hypothetical protein
LKPALQEALIEYIQQEALQVLTPIVRDPQLPAPDSGKRHGRRF